MNPKLSPGFVEISAHAMVGMTERQQEAAVAMNQTAHEYRYLFFNMQDAWFTECEKVDKLRKEIEMLRARIRALDKIDEL